MQKRAVQFTKKPYLPLFLSETADKFARDYAIKKSFRHALHIVTAYLHCQNQVAHAVRTRDSWLASLSIHFPIHFARRAHEYPVTLSTSCLVSQILPTFHDEQRCPYKCVADYNLTQASQSMPCLPDSVMSFSLFW